MVLGGSSVGRKRAFYAALRSFASTMCSGLKPSGTRKRSSQMFSVSEYFPKFLIRQMQECEYRVCVLREARYWWGCFCRSLPREGVEPWLVNPALFALLPPKLIGGLGLSFTGLKVAPPVFLPVDSALVVLAVERSRLCKSFAFASAADDGPVVLLLTAIFLGAFSGGDFLTLNWFACWAEPTTQKSNRATATASGNLSLGILNPLLRDFKLPTIRCTLITIPLPNLCYVKPPFAGKHSGIDKES